MDAVAVVLEFMRPIGAGGRRRDELGELGRDERGQRSRTGGGVRRPRLIWSGRALPYADNRCGCRQVPTLLGQCLGEHQ